MKLWQFLKRWRQAYLDDKGDRLHAETERNTLCNRLISIEEVQHKLSPHKSEDVYAQAYQEAIRIFPSNREEKEMW